MKHLGDTMYPGIKRRPQQKKLRLIIWHMMRLDPAGRDLKMFWKNMSESNVALTDNGDLALKSTLSRVLDMFSRGPAYRSRTTGECQLLFRSAYEDDPLLSMKCLFYIRDSRKGPGERKFFRDVLPIVPADAMVKNIKNVPEFGRWDDLFSLIGTDLEDDVVSYIKMTLKKDIDACTKNEPVSLLGKWMPSANTSSRNTVRLAVNLRNSLGMSPGEYRKTLSQLRKQISIVESKMSGNEWSDIKYENVPSKASLNYSKAFSRHDGIRYSGYLSDVKKGKKKINASVIYPHEIVRKILLGETDIAALDVMWNNLPDYCGSESAIVMCDTSGSMQWLRSGNYMIDGNGGNSLPLSIAIGLSMYIAERNKNRAFKNHFFTFSSCPELQEIRGATIVEKVNNLSKVHWSQNTNYRLALKVMLVKARDARVPDSEMPKTLYIVSDMQFDQSFHVCSTFDDIKDMYQDAGYTFPRIVFWQVNAFKDNSPATKNEMGVILVGGVSPAMLRYMYSGTGMENPEQFMLRVLNDPRYDAIKA